MNYQLFLSIIISIATFTLGLLGVLTKTKEGDKVTGWGKLVIVFLIISSIFTLANEFQKNTTELDNKISQEKKEKEESLKRENEYKTIISKADQSLRKFEIINQQTNSIVTELKRQLILQDSLNKSTIKILQKTQLIDNNTNRILNPLFPIELQFFYTLSLMDPTLLPFKDSIFYLKSKLEKNKIRDLKNISLDYDDKGNLIGLSSKNIKGYEELSKVAFVNESSLNPELKTYVVSISKNNFFSKESKTNPNVELLTFSNNSYLTDIEDPTKRNFHNISISFIDNTIHIMDYMKLYRILENPETFKFSIQDLLNSFIFVNPQSNSKSLQLKSLTLHMGKDFTRQISISFTENDKLKNVNTIEGYYKKIVSSPAK